MYLTESSLKKSNTLAVISGSTVKAVYGVSDWIWDKTLNYLDATVEAKLYGGNETIEHEKCCGLCKSGAILKKPLLTYSCKRINNKVHSRHQVEPIFSH